MDCLLGGAHTNYYHAYLDDIIIYSNKLEYHLRHLWTIFNLYSSWNISISLSKSYIWYLNIELLDCRGDRLGLLYTAYHVKVFEDLEFPS
jgi:hypothetical protein